MKRFLEWIGLKEKLDSKKHKPPLFKESEVWWCYTGENIGIEINGKGSIFTRPVLIYRKYDKYSFLGLPLSTKNKSGSWYAPIKFKGFEQVVVLCQGRTFDYKRLKEKTGTLEKDQMDAVNTKYTSLHLK